MKKIRFLSIMFIFSLLFSCKQNECDDSYTSCFREYLEANNFKSFNGMNDEEMAIECNKILVQQINTRWEKGISVDKMLLPKDLNYLAGPHGFMEYSWDRFDNTTDSTKKIAIILGMKMLYDILKAVPPDSWGDRDVKKCKSEWFNNHFKSDFVKFLNDERFKNHKLDSLMSIPENIK